MAPYMQSDLCLPLDNYKSRPNVGSNGNRREQMNIPCSHSHIGDGRVAEGLGYLQLIEDWLSYSSLISNVLDVDGNILWFGQKYVATFCC